MIKKFIYRTPIKNETFHTYQIEDVQQTLTQIFQSHNNNKGIYSIEFYKGKGYYLTSPTFDISYGNIINTIYPIFDDCVIYELWLKYPIFLPINEKESLNLEELPFHFFQLLLCKQNDLWREWALEQYLDYLKGNEYPLKNKWLRNTQTSLIIFFQKLGNFQNHHQPIPEVEEKLLKPHFRVECRFIVHKSKVLEFEYYLTQQLNKKAFYNQFIFSRNTIQQEIITRSFTTSSQDHLLSDSEILSLFTMNETLSEVQQPIEIEETTSTPSILELPKPKQTTDESIDEQTIKLLSNAFKRIKLTDKQLKIIETRSGITLHRITIKIPLSLTYSTIHKNLKNIQAAMGNDSVSMEMGDQPDTIHFYIPRKNRGVLYLQDCMQSESFTEFKKQAKLPFVIGENTSGELLFGCLNQLKHLLVAGATGSGKSVFLNNILISMLLNVPPHMIQFHLIDPKKNELVFYEDFPQVKKVITDMSQAKKELEWITEEMERRYELLGANKCRILEQLNHKKKNKIPYIVCVIDEYADLMDTNPEIESYVVRLGQKARAAGIHLIIATQKPLATVITSRLKTNLPSVIGFRMKSANDYMTVFGKNIPYHLLGNGDGVAMLEGSTKEFERFQSPILTLDEQEENQWFEQLKNHFQNHHVNNDLDTLKKIIANTGEVRVAHLQKEMGKRINVVSELMKQLVQEGWLEKQSKGYSLIASEEELNKWRTSE